MEEKITGFWSSLQRHPIRTLIATSLVLDAGVKVIRCLFGKN